MTHHSSTMTRDRRTLRAPVSALSARTDDAVTKQDTGVGGRNAHDLGLEPVMNFRYH